MPPRVAVLGIGNEVNGDDAAGIAAVRALLPRLAGQEHVLVLDTGAAPENYTGPVRRFRPDLIVLIDAAQMNEPPGTIRWLDWTETDGLSASTHTLPPFVLAKFLISDLHCDLGLVGIQPASNQMTDPITLSPVVQAAIEEVVATIAAHLDTQ